MNIAKESKNNPKIVYSYVNNKSLKKSSIGPILDDAGDLKSGDVDKTNILNNFFASVYTIEDLTTIPAMNDVIDFNITNILDSVEITEEEVSFQIDKLLLRKSPGPDGFFPMHLKRLKNVIVQPLTKIFKKSLKQILFFAISFIIANTFLSYIIGVDKLYKYVADGPWEHFGTF